jgi:hypothetical protein
MQAERRHAAASDGRRSEHAALSWKHVSAPVSIHYLHLVSGGFVR